MVVLWHVGLARERAKMAILKNMLWLQLQNHALILIRLSFPLASPNDRSTFVPVRDSARAEHVVFDHCGIDERIPYFGDRSVDFNLCFSNKCILHISSKKIAMSNLPNPG